MISFLRNSLFLHAVKYGNNKRIIFNTLDYVLDS